MYISDHVVPRTRRPACPTRVGNYGAHVAHAYTQDAGTHDSQQERKFPRK